MSATPAMTEVAPATGTDWKPYPAYKHREWETLERIPEEWEVRRLEHVARCRLSSVDKKKHENEQAVRLCNYTDVYYHERITDDLELMEATATADEIRNFSLKEGDVLITKDSESWEDIAVPAWVPADLDRVVCGYHLAQIRPHRDRMLGSFLFRCLQAGPVNQQFRLAATGITRYGIASHAISDALLPCPPLNDQRAISAFLDRQTAKIDELIAKKGRLIELLDEKRTALITQAVTKGLDPDVPMKDSGVEWLGEIPAHWEAAKLRHLSSVQRGASPRPIEDPKYFDADGEYGWVRIRDVTSAGMYLKSTEQTLSEFGRSKSISLGPGRLILSIAATVGEPIITDMKCCIHDGFVYFEDLKLVPEYLYFIFKSHGVYSGLGKLGTQLNLNTDTVGDIRVPVPTEREQWEIVHWLKEHSQRLAAVAEAGRQVIDLLREYRSALITAAVTGKIDVRGYAA